MEKMKAEHLPLDYKDYKEPFLLKEVAAVGLGIQ